MSFSQRKKRALGAAQAAGSDAFLITHPPDIRYLCGFSGSSAALALTGGDSRLFTDGRYREQAAAEARGTPVVIESKPPAIGATVWLSGNAERCAFDENHTSMSNYGSWKSTVPAAKRRSFLRPTSNLIAALREIKDGDEVLRMRAAAALGCDVFDRVLPAITSGVTETQIAIALEGRAKEKGAEAMSFDTIIASGARSALPHGRASMAKLPRVGFVTLDFGVILNGYCSDMTRTVHLGRPKPEARRVYDFVLEAQLAAVAAVRPGVQAGDVDEAARSVLRRAGLEKEFVHSTGHGVGLEIHESPRIATKQTTRLRAGMVITIEPGVYFAGRFGIRIEDMVLVTKGGAEVLTPSTKALIEL